MYVSILKSAASNICDRMMNTVQRPPSAHGSPILRLTPALRRQIYSHFHYALGRIPVTFHIYGLNNRRRQAHASGFHALLLSCRTIYDEVSEVLYSANYFEVKYEDTVSFQRIRNLSDSSLASLTELKIVLNEVPCRSSCNREILEALDCHSKRQSGHTSCHNQVLRPSEDSVSNMLEDWSLTAAYICSRVTPEKLNMSLVCDFDPQDPRVSSAARLAVAPLNNLAPLKSCHVRLCRTPHRELERVAQNAVLRACGIIDREEPAYTLNNATAGSGSMLMSLPREIRFRILEYTDLITPWKEVRWSRQHTGYQPSIVSCHRQGCPSELHHGCQFRKCWSGYLPPEYRHLDPRPPVGCFCRVRHAAFSFNCRCWIPPTDLFLVCRALCEDARVVFFSGNRFVVHDYDSCAPWDEYGLGSYPNDRLAVSEFLTEIVPVACLAEIRSLEVAFPPYSHDAWPQDGCRALSDWGDTIRLIKQKMNLEGLTLQLTMHEGEEFGAIDYLEDMTKSQAREIQRAYDRILGPLAGLGEEGLKGFFAYMTLPEKWTLWAMYGRGYQARILQKQQTLKECAELLVMGSRYDKQPGDEFHRSGEPVNSVWRKKYTPYPSWARG